MFSRPQNNECNEYYKKYIALVPQGPLLDVLAQQPGSYRQLLAAMPNDKASAPSAPGKWSIKQALGHVCDTERIMTYRALRFARGDEKELQGFEQDDYVREAESNARSLEDLLAEFESLRDATIALFSSMPSGAQMRAGIASGSRVTVRALAYIVAGHAQHHFELLQAQLAAKAAPGR